MRLLDELRAEHELIERVAGAHVTFVERGARGEAIPDDAAAFLRFLRDFSGGFHHAREEDSLFPALAQAGLSTEKGPVASLVAQHRAMEATLAELAPLLVSERPEGEAAARASALARSYAEALWHHIDAENSVLLPESARRLGPDGVAALVSRAESPEESAARLEGERLVALYPPDMDLGAVRGEGCALCASYGAGCEGLEREWWTETEWEEFESRSG
jgi:hemerythrin-like domain-containing protein